jgi:hypothetical protein
MNPATTQQEPAGGTHVEINDPTSAADTPTAETTETKRKVAKSRSRRINSGKKNTTSGKSFAVPIGESGQTFDSVWQFGE